MLNKIYPPTLIAEGTTTQGSFVFSSEALIFGAIEGEVRAETVDTLQIGRTGWVQGNIIADGPVFVEGRVIGNISSKTKVSVSTFGSVEGTITAPRIEVIAGARVDGELHTRTEKPSTHSVKRAA